MTKYIIVIICFTHNVLFCQQDLISFGDEWKYYDEGIQPADQTTLKWYDKDYSDTGWDSGVGQLGYGDGDEQTLLTLGVYTAYFRKDINVVDPSTYDFIALKLLFDDGAAVYINGVEVWALNMAAKPYTYDSFTPTAGSDNAIVETQIANVLIVGANVIAVEVHQRSSGSSDISFDFELKQNYSSAIEITRGPYLQQGTHKSVKIKWSTSTPAMSEVNYGTSLNNLNLSSSDGTLKTKHTIYIKGLLPNTRYFYKISDGTNLILQPSTDLYFETSPLPGSKEKITAWVLGDCGTGNNNARAVRDAYFDHIGQEHTDLILLLGDNAYNEGTDLQYQSAIFENMYEDKLKNSFVWSTLGNHDGISANSSSLTGPYYDIFDFPMAGECGGVASGTEAYYSFDYGNAHFVVLESNESDRSVGGAMYNWCLSDLQNTTADWIIGIWHHPAYTKGSHNSDTEIQLIEMRSNFLPLLESYGVDLVLNGHSHSYERSYLLNGHYGLSNSFDALVHTIGSNGDGDGKPDGDGTYIKTTSGGLAGAGATYITAGSSGKISGGALNHNAMFSSINALGSCVMTIHKDSLQMQFLESSGSVTDYFSIIKSYDCPLIRDLGGNLFDRTYYAREEISSDAVLISPDISTFKSGNNIKLTTNFEIGNGSIFHALIEDCPD
ncbi:MAG: hypothetical protein ACI9FN_000908 [Saprospiraceae bacterium]|jgi:hypothetical protein